jgi:hypothetical protein
MKPINGKLVTRCPSGEVPNCFLDFQFFSEREVRAFLCAPDLDGASPITYYWIPYRPPTHDETPTGGHTLSEQTIQEDYELAKNDPHVLLLPVQEVDWDGSWFTDWSVDILPVPEDSRFRTGCWVKLVPIGIWNWPTHTTSLGFARLGCRLKNQLELHMSVYTDTSFKPSSRLNMGLDIVYNHNDTRIVNHRCVFTMIQEWSVWSKLTREAREYIVHGFIQKDRTIFPHEVAADVMVSIFHDHGLAGDKIMKVIDELEKQRPQAMPQLKIRIVGLHWQLNVFSIIEVLKSALSLKSDLDLASAQGIFASQLDNVNDELHALLKKDCRKLMLELKNVEKRHWLLVLLEWMGKCAHNHNAEWAELLQCLYIHPIQCPAVMKLLLNPSTSQPSHVDNFQLGAIIKGIVYGVDEGLRLTPEVSTTTIYAGNPSYPTLRPDYTRATATERNFKARPLSAPTASSGRCVLFAAPAIVHAYRQPTEAQDKLRFEVQAPAKRLFVHTEMLPAGQPIPGVENGEYTLGYGINLLQRHASAGNGHLYHEFGPTHAKIINATTTKSPVQCRPTSPKIFRLPAGALSDIGQIPETTRQAWALQFAKMNSDLLARLQEYLPPNLRHLLGQPEFRSAQDSDDTTLTGSLLALELIGEQLVPGTIPRMTTYTHSEFTPFSLPHLSEGGWVVSSPALLASEERSSHQFVVFPSCLMQSIEEFETWKSTMGKKFVYALDATRCRWLFPHPLSVPVCHVLPEGVSFTQTMMPDRVVKFLQSDAIFDQGTWATNFKKCKPESTGTKYYAEGYFEGGECPDGALNPRNHTITHDNVTNKRTQAKHVAVYLEAFRNLNRKVLQTIAAQLPEALRKSFLRGPVDVAAQCHSGDRFNGAYHNDPAAGLFQIGITLGNQPRTLTFDHKDSNDINILPAHVYVTSPWLFSHAKSVPACKLQTAGGLNTSLALMCRLSLTADEKDKYDNFKNEESFGDFKNILKENVRQVPCTQTAQRQHDDTHTHKHVYTPTHPHT